MDSIKYSLVKRKRICEYAMKNSVTEAQLHYGASRPTIYRWLKRFDGSKDSLKDYSKKPHSHPNQSTPDEVDLIKRLWHKNKQFGVDYLYGKLKRQYGYMRCRETVYNVLKREGLKYKPPKKKRKRSKGKPYHGATIPGEKMQMDVKYVPTKCMPSELVAKGVRWYQWTIIDEATSLRFTWFYDNKLNSYSVDFVERARRFFPFPLQKIQTDNGTEFTFRFLNTDKLSSLERYLFCEGIEHQLLRPATPWHNGRVERSHRTDDKFFYDLKEFSNLKDLRKQGENWRKRYNNMYVRKYKYLSPIEVWKAIKLTGRHPIYHDNMQENSSQEQVNGATLHS